MVGDDTAFIGSVNLTETGLNKNAEIGVQFEDNSETKELQQWFDELWSRTEVADIPELRTYVEKAASTTTQPTVSMPDTGPSFNTTLPLSEQSNTTAEDAGHKNLAEAIEHAPSKEWIETYLDWVAKLIDFTGLGESDERIATTVPTPRKIAVNVNQRYVLTAYPKTSQIGLMLPGDSTAVEELSEYIGDFGQFSTPLDTDPYWFEFPTPIDRFISDTIEEDWKRAVRNELSRGERSSHRNAHNATVFRAAVDREYREKVLKTPSQYK